MEKIKTGILIKNALRAIVFPHRVFKEIPSDKKMNYLVVIPIMALGGILYLYLHLAAVHFYTVEALVREAPERLVMMFDHTIYSVWELWATGCMFFYLLGKMFKKKVNFYALEIGVFYLWMVWAVMPLFDFSHVILNMYYPTVDAGPFGTIEVHFGLFPAAVIVFFESFFFMRDCLGFRGRQTLVAILISGAIVPYGKLLLNRGLLVVSGILHLDLTTLTLIFTSIGVTLYILIRIHAAGGYKKILSRMRE